MREMDQLLRATARAEATHFWFRGFRRFVEPLLQRATNGVSDGRLLDFGCGTGANLDLLGRFGRAYGFDLTYVGLKIGKEAGRTRLVQASVADAPVPSDAFDVVTSFDVLYGLPEPIERAAVAEMFRAVKPGGYIIVNVAALDCLKGDHSVLGREVRRYNRKSLSRLLDRAPASPSSASPTRTRRCSCRCSRSAPTSGGAACLRKPTPNRTSASRLRRSICVLSGVLSVESWWVRRFNNPFGSSLLCLARKPGRSHS